MVQSKESKMIFRFTEKMAKKLKLGPLTKIDDQPSNPYLEWYANYFFVDRMQIILVTNAASLLSIVMHGRGITNDDLFFKQFIDQLGDYLKEIDCELILHRIIAPKIGTAKLSKTTDRSILGSMNEMKKYIEVRYMKDWSPMELTDLINDTYFNGVGFKKPRNVFKTFKLDQRS